MDKSRAKMNLSTLQRHDPSILEIIDTSRQVTVYAFSTASKEWQKTDIEGTLFISKRSCRPFYNVLVLNKKGPQNLIEPISSGVQLQVKETFLLYRSAVDSIRGLWFAQTEECNRIMGTLQQILLSLQSQARLEETSKVIGPDILSLLNNAQKKFDSTRGTELQAEPVKLSASLSAGEQVVKPQAIRLDSRPIDSAILHCSSSGASSTAELATLADLQSSPVAPKPSIRSINRQMSQPLPPPKYPVTTTVASFFAADTTNVHISYAAGRQSSVSADMTPSLSEGLSLSMGALASPESPTLTGRLSQAATLLTPDMFAERTIPRAFPSPIPSFGDDYLMPPETFEAAMLVPPQHLTPPPTPLTREQLRLSLVYLLEHDDDFMSSIHSAFLMCNR